MIESPKFKAELLKSKLKHLKTELIFNLRSFQSLTTLVINFHLKYKNSFNNWGKMIETQQLRKTIYMSEDFINWYPLFIDKIINTITKNENLDFLNIDELDKSSQKNLFNSITLMGIIASYIDKFEEFKKLLYEIKFLPTPDSQHIHEKTYFPFIFDLTKNKLFIGYPALPIGNSIEECKNEVIRILHDAENINFDKLFTQLSKSIDDTRGILIKDDSDFETNKSTSTPSTIQNKDKKNFKISNNKSLSSNESKIDKINTINQKLSITTIKWNESPDMLQKLLQSLVQNEYIRYIDNKLIDAHFSYKKIKMVPNNKLEKIHWLKFETHLACLMDYLKVKGKISIDKEKIHVITAQHFCKKDGKNYDSRVLTQTLNNIIGYKEKKSFKNLISIIEDSFSNDL